MSVSGLSSLLSSLLQAQTSQTSSTQTPSSSTATASSNAATQTTASASDPSYMLSLSQQQATTQLLGYSQLGRLVGQAESQLGNLADQNSFATGINGPQTSYQVNVTQLAQPQTLVSGSYAAADTQVVDPGTMTITTGGSAVPVSITDGSLNGIAAAVNAANAGVTASVVQTADGQSQLQLTGNAGGTANAFTVSGIPGLSYDPTASGGGLTATQTAQDAQYSVNGVAKTNGSNDNAPIASGVVLTLSALGATSISVPQGLGDANTAAQSLADTVNSLVTGLSQEGLSGSGAGASLAQTIQTIAGQSFGGGSISTLADIGLTVQSDGTLAVNTQTLQQAYSTDPTATRTVIARATSALQQALDGGAGASGQIQSQIQALTASMMQGTSLLDLLNGGSGSQSSSSLGALASLMGQTSGSSGNSSLDSLLSALGGGGQTGTGQSGSSSLDSLLSALGASGQTGTGTGASSTVNTLLSSLLGNSASGTGTGSGTSGSDLLNALSQALSQSSSQSQG